VRLLLHVDSLQPDIASSLMQLLPEYQGEEASDAMTTTRLILSQFRWLEHIVDGAALVGAASEMMQVADAPLKRELLLVLPDLVQDGQHAAAADTLRSVLGEDTQFLASVLDAFGSLVLEPDALAEVCASVMDAVAGANVEDLPVVVRFLLQHMTKDSAKATVAALRTGMQLDLLRGGDAAAGGGEASGEALVLDALTTAMRLRKDVAVLVVKHLGGIAAAADHTPVDAWLLCAAYTASAATERKKVLKLVLDKACGRLLSAALLRAAIAGHGVALAPHFATLLELATVLLQQKGRRAAVEAGSDLYCLAFDEFADVFKRQELLSRVMAHVGSGADAEVEAALRVLVRLASADAVAVRHFAPFLTYVLDYLSSLSVVQARLAFELFARLAYDGAPDCASRLTDELLITIRKQLSSSTPHYKCLGLLGGCTMLHRLGVQDAAAAADGEGVSATQPPPPSQARGSQAAASQKPLSARMQEAHSLFAMMCGHSASADGTFAFLLHELSHLVAARGAADALSRPLLELVIDKVTSNFESRYLVDAAESLQENAKVRGLQPKLALDIDRAGEEGIAVRITPMLAHSDEAAALQRHALSTLSANFQLLRLCEAATSEDGESLEAVDAVLGAPLVLFEPRLIGERLEAFRDLPADTREAACLALFYAVDWIRELLNGFCTQRDPEMRAKVVLRATQLAALEGVLDALLGETPHFRLPGIIWDSRAAAAKAKAAAPKAAATKKPAVAKKAAAGKAKPASKAAGKKPAAAGKGKSAAGKGRGKKKSAVSDVDSSGDEDGDEPAGAGEEEEEEEEPAPEPAAAGGAGSSSAAATKKKAKASPSSVLARPNLARVSPHLRGISIHTSLILTYGSGHMRKEVDTRDETVALNKVELTAGATHLLLAQLLAKVQAAISSGGARTSPAKAAGGRRAIAVQDLSSMELSLLDAPKLLAALKPVLLSFRELLETLGERLRGADGVPPPDEAEHETTLIEAFEGSELSESRAARGEFTHSSFVLMLRVLQELLAWDQLRDAAAEADLLDVLAYFGSHGSLSSQAPPSAAAAAASGRAKAETCAGAFDFFETLRQGVGSASLLAEILDVQAAIVKLQGRLTKAVPTPAQRQAKLAECAEHILLRPDGRLKGDKLLAPTLKTILECQAAHTDKPRELIRTCAEEWLSSLEDDPKADPPEEQPFLSLKTAPQYLRTMFGLLRRECAALDGGTKAPLEDHADLSAAAVTAELKELVELFSSLAQAMRGTHISSINIVTLRESAVFLAWFNSRALPFISSQFIGQHGEMITLLKAIQPTTRMLQALCVDVKARLETGCLTPASTLKRELESLVLQVKVMLQKNGCREAFWVGNLKHKNSSGVEVSSQMYVEAKKGLKKAGTPKKKKKVKKKKADDDEDEPVDVDADDEEEDGDAMAVDGGGTSDADEEDEDEEGEEDEEDEEDDPEEGDEEDEDLDDDEEEDEEDEDDDDEEDEDEDEEDEEEDEDGYPASMVASDEE